MRLKIWLAVVLCLGACAVSRAEPILDADAQKRIDTAVEGAIGRHVAPSMCVVIGTADKALFAKAYGRLTYDPNSPEAALDTIYDMASVSKAVGTTSAALLLVQDGKLSLDDKVSKYIPAWDRDDKRDIQIRQLMCHVSGMPSYTNASLAEAERKEGESKADALTKLIASLPLKYKTGEDYVYACLNFLTLARVNETILGKTQDAFLQERLFKPLGMVNTGYYLNPEQKSHAAPTTPKLQGSVHDPLAAYYVDENHCPGNAGLFSTANDLTAFCRMILSNGTWNGQQIFKPETIDQMATNQVPLRVRELHGTGWGRSLSYPFATKLNRGFAKACMSHSGYTGTYVHFDRLAGTFVIVLTNRVYPDDGASDYRLRKEILGIVLEADPIYKDVLETN